MDIRKKLYLDLEGLKKEGPITIVAFGDSITHGGLIDSCDYEMVYWNVLKKKINAVRDFMPVNVINAGIGGTCACDGVGRIKKQVLNYNPDLVIVCFGLNDVNFDLDNYTKSLEKIFKKIKKSGIECIFMTPNMLNTYVADDTQEVHMEYAKKTAEMQNSGKMDLYMESAKAVAEKLGITVCDCYSEWKKLSETEDTTSLLINRINHPNQKMHEFFAEKLFKTIFGEKIEKGESESTMIRKD